MKIDINRVATAAIDAALHEEPSRRRRVPGVHASAAGAALAAAARVGQKHLPRLTELRLLEHGLTKLADMPNLRDVTETVRERFADRGWAHDDDDLEDSAVDDNEEDMRSDEEPSSEAEGDEPEEDDEPEDDDDEPPPDEDDEPPRTRKRRRTTTARARSPTRTNRPPRTMMSVNRGTRTRGPTTTSQAMTTRQATTATRRRLH